MIKVCEYCGVEYKGPPKRKYCSRKCSGRAHSDKVEQECEYCGKTFFTWPSYRARGGGRFCGHKCRAKSQTTKVEHKCEICGKPFLVKLTYSVKGKGRYCSRKCAGVDRYRKYSGEKVGVGKAVKLPRPCVSEIARNINYGAMPCSPVTITLAKSVENVVVGSKPTMSFPLLIFPNTN